MRISFDPCLCPSAPPTRPPKGVKGCGLSVALVKLPMKKRWLETQRSLEAFVESAGGAVEVRARQLYHDREEITVLARRVAGA